MGAVRNVYWEDPAKVTRGHFKMGIIIRICHLVLCFIEVLKVDCQVSL